MKKTPTKTPSSFTLSLDDRLQILANLIIDRIQEDQKNGVVRVKNTNKDTQV